MMLRRFDEAIASFDVCLAKGAGSAALYEARGLAHASMGSFERALADDTMAINLGPPGATLLANRGWAYLLSGAASLALGDFDHALRVDPANGHALSGRALTFAQLRKPAEAIQDAQASLRLNPDDPRQVYNAARVYCQAATCLDSPGDRNNRATGLADRHRAEAIRLLTRALELCPDPDRPRFWDEVVRKDATLEPLRRLRVFHDLRDRAIVVRTPTDLQAKGDRP